MEYLVTNQDLQLFPVGEAAEAVVAQLVKRLDLMSLKEVQLS